MRTLLLASAAVLALGGSAMAQNAAGNPRSAAASNITSSDTHSKLAPALPSPGGDLEVNQLLMRASRDIKAGRTGAAQEALEEAETRLLDRSTPQTASGPITGPRIDAITRALHALAARDRAGAMSATQMAMTAGNGMGGGGMNAGGMGTMNGGTMNGGAMNAGTMAPAGGTMATMPMAPAPINSDTAIQPPGSNDAQSTRFYTSCPTPPCQQGVPTAAPGGEAGSGPGALRTGPSNSPVATGAGGGDSGGSGAKGGGAGSSGQ